MATQLAESPFVFAWQSFFCEAGTAEYGEKYLRTDPLVVAHPEFFVDEFVPMRDWPNPIDQMLEANKQRAIAQETERRQKFEAAARQNPATLSIETFKASRDFYASIEGQPTLVKKGSQVVAGDVLLTEHPDVWERAR